MIMLTYHNIKLSAIVNTHFTMWCQNECHKTSWWNWKKVLAVSKQNILMLSKCKKKKGGERFWHLQKNALKINTFPWDVFILTGIEFSGLKLIHQNVFTLSEWYPICSQTSVSGWASTLSSSEPHRLTYTGRCDPEPAWAESHISVKLASAHDTVFVLAIGCWRAENT